MQGVNAHHARVSMPEPSHAFFAGWGDLAAVAAAALDVCTFGRPVRLRSRGAARAACGEAAADRRGLVDTAAAVTPDSAPDAGCASGFTHSATGSGPDVAARGRERARSCTWRSTAERTLDVYRELTR